KFTNNGQLLWSTYFGGDGIDVGNDLIIDKSNNAVITGTSSSSINFPKLFPFGAFSDSIMSYNNNAFVAKFTNSGNLIWSTFYGLNYTEGKTISVDNNNNIIVAGNSVGSDGNNIQTANNGGYFLANSSTTTTDNFIALFNPSCQLTWATNFGGNGNDAIYSSVVDNANNLYLIGNTNSTDLPLKKYSTTGYYDSILNTNGNSQKTDLFILKFNTNSQLKWCTLLGGSNNEGDNYSTNYYPNYYYYSYPHYHFSNDLIKTDACNNVYISLETFSSDMPTKEYDCEKYFDKTFSGVYDNAVYIFDKNTTMRWGTYLNVLNGSRDTANLIFGKKLPIRLALNSNNNLFTAQSFDAPISMLSTNSLAAQITANYFNSGYAQNFLMRFAQPIQKPKFNTSLCSAGCTGSASVNNLQSCNSGIKPSYLWSNGDTGLTATNLCKGSNYLVISDTTMFCFADTFYLDLKNGIDVYPVQSGMSCPALCNGTYSINIPGVTPTSITWYARDTIFTNIASLGHLCYGLDTVVVDVAGCGSDTTIFTNQQIPLLTLQLNSITSDFLRPCLSNCDNTAEVLAFGGNGPIHIWWTNGDTGRIAKHLCTGSTYTVYATDSSCYTSKLQVTIPIPSTYTYSGINYSYPASCLPINSCSVYFMLNNVNVTSKMKFIWNTGDTTAVINNKPPGYYTCKIYNECFTSTVSANLYTRSSYFTYYVNCKAAIDSIADVSLYSNPSGYPFNWYINGVLQNQQNIYNPIFHHINILHDSISLTTACNTITQRITNNYSFQINEDYNTNTPTCKNSCNGSTRISATGATLPITYKVYNQFNSFIGTYSWWLTNLCYGTYTVIGSDSCGNTDTISIFIDNYCSFYINNVSTTPTCNGFCFGTADVYGGINVSSWCNGSGLAYPLTYKWDGASGYDYYSGLCSGSHTLVVTDGCGSSDNYNF
ncbi:MAG: hypothetical protein RI955_809, partial [Bacteroidota bacterium]